MLEDVKQALRIRSSQDGFDQEVQDLIEAAKMDLQQSGISAEKAESDDPLIKRAVITYCKGNFGIDNTKADQFNDAYVMLKQHLSLAGDYR